jgi:hypothetical protein
MYIYLMEELLQNTHYHEESDNICHIIRTDLAVFLISYSRTGELVTASEVVYLTE